tara:strand:- start:5169 stop:5657 length:489 start_codon:yes stop_codon:yes gene_type:complete
MALIHTYITQINISGTLLTEIQIRNRPVVPYVRQTHRSRFSPRAIRYNNDQVALKDILNLAMLNFNIEPYDKNCKLFVSVEYAMKPDKQKNSVKRIDIDNIYKAVSDAMNNVVYHDDRQIYHTRIRKFKSNINNVYIKIDNRYDIEPDNAIIENMSPYAMIF